MPNNIFSYTKRDYESSRKEGLAKIPQLSNGVWTDLNASDPGIIILDYVHALVDMINFYQDHQALETFITTAKERANIFRLAKQLSYKVRSAKSSQVEVTFHSDFYYNYPIKIPKGTRVSTKDSINFVTTQDAYLKVGESEVTVLCQQGDYHEYLYEGTGLSRLSNVEPPYNVNQSVELNEDLIDTESIYILDNLGRIWSPIDFIVFSTDIDRVYQVELNPNNTVTIKFGDGERGIIPKETETLTIKYLVTQADKGRIGPNSIVTCDPIYDDNGKYIEFTVYNKEESIGGYAPQSSTSIRETAPGAIKAQDRAVTIADFENLAKLVPGVAEARAYDINVNTDIPFHEVRVLVVPEDDTSSNHILVDEVYRYLYQRMIPPTTLTVTLPTDIFIDIEVVVRKLPGIDDGVLEYEIDKIIRDYFDSRSNVIGEDFYPTDLSIKIASLTYVKYVVSISPSESVSIEDLSRAKLGKLTIKIE